MPIASRENYSNVNSYEAPTGANACRNSGCD